MKGKKTDVEIKAKIIKSLVWWKQWSDIAKEEWVHESTVSRIKDNDLQEVARESKIISEIIENDMESVRNMSEITKRFTEQVKAKEELDRNDIATANQTVESAFKRSQLLSGKATERIDINGYEQLEAIKKWEKSIDDAYAVFNTLRSQSE